MSDSTETANRVIVTLLYVQGAYFAILGVWPIIDIHSFQAVSGPKTDHLVTGNENDHWLVLTVGALITVIGLTLLVSAWRGTASAETAVLGAGSALALATIDVIYAMRDVIDEIYLADAAVELVFIVGWVVALTLGRRSTGGAGNIV